MKVCKDGRKWGKMNTDYHDPEYIKKQRDAKLGDKNPHWKGGLCAGVNKKNRIKKGYNPNSAFKKGIKLFGKNNPNWQGGITSENHLVRTGIEYRLWREAVFARDNWTCRCGKRGGELNAHHVKSFAKYPELRLAIDNGITFCVKCHKKYKGKEGIKMADDKNKGNQGNQGNQGDKGNQGNQGNTGKEGEKGNQGNQGNKGEKGDPAPKQ